MTLGQILTTVSHREYLVMAAWLKEQWNDPPVECHYLMQLTAVVQRLLHKKPASVTDSQFKIPFKWRYVKAGDNDDKVSRDKAALISKAKWFAGVGGKIRIRKKDGTLQPVNKVPGKKQARKPSGPPKPAPRIKNDKRRLQDPPHEDE